MPIYEYQCLVCGEQFDKLFLSLSRVPTEITCPKCQSNDTRRLISAPAVHTGNASSSQTEAADPTPAKPPVFGRKELNQALEKKKQLRESAASK